MLTLTAEVLVPLIIVALPFIIFLILQSALISTVLLILILFILLPVFVAFIQKAAPAEKKRFDPYLVPLATLTLISIVLWLPSMAILALFYLLFCFIIKTRRAAPYFLLLCMFSSLILLLSGSMPLGGELLSIPYFILSLLIGLGLYMRIVGKKRFVARLKIALTLGMIFLCYVSMLTYMSGGKTGWLTWAIVKQKGVELLLPAHPYITGPRAVMPVKDGLLIYTNEDKFILSHDKSLDKFSPATKIGRVDLPICDPDDRSICYIPTHEREGITILNTSNWQINQTDFHPVDYDFITADKQFRYLAVLESKDRYLSVAKRVAPGKLEKVAELDLQKLGLVGNTGFLDFMDDKLIIVTLTSNIIRSFSFNIESKKIHEFIEVGMPYEISACWYGVIVENELIVLALLSGRVLVIDTTGKEIGSSYLLPLLRHAIYDPQQKLCYLVSDLGFLFIHDPWHAKNIKTLFLGFKTKNVHHEGDYLYIGSTAGIFKIDIDKAISKND